MLYRLFGFWIRREACRCAAEAVKGDWAAGRDAGSTLWCLTVFFERYMHLGADVTQADFGPKEPVELGIVRSPRSGEAG